MQSDGGLTPVEKYECKEKDFIYDKRIFLDFVDHEQFFLDLQVD